MKPLVTKRLCSILHGQSCRVIAMAIAALMINGCSDKPKSATQIAATVNKDEISVHQINNVLTGLPHVSVENMEVTRAAVLTNLINEQLAVQQAITLKLDRSPAVMMQLDASKRQILANAYLRQLAAATLKPNAEDAKKFYDAHPELFAQRRIYKLQEITLQKPHPSVAELQIMIKGKSVDEIEMAIKQSNIVYTKNSGTRAAEQIALPMLSEVAKLGDGQTSVIDTPQMTSIVYVEASQLAPVSEALALQKIPQYLANEKSKLAIRDNLNFLKNKSKIEYMNEFKNMAATATPNATTQNALATATPEPLADTKKTSSGLEKGIAGL